jgi:microcin C transport system substrate-binding protein
MYNYDEITIKYFKDQTIALEAFKAGEFDFLSVNIAKQWARDMKGAKFDSGEIIKRNFPHFNNAGMQGFVMNTRRPLFQDRRVRQALGLALDFEWINRALFFDQYKRTDSFFSNSPLAAKGLPSGLELKYLQTYRSILPRQVFSAPLVPPRVTSVNGLRENLKKARDLLAAGGWTVKDGFLVNKDGKKFQFEILLVSQSFERVMAPYVINLRKLGIKAEYRTVDQTLYVERLKRFDFDMVVATFGQSLSPGNEQRNYWHSSAADRKGSKNYAGIRSKAVDGLVDKIIYAGNSQELSAACKALDRVLWYGYYVVPNWYLDSHRISYYRKIHFPKILPLYYDPTQLFLTSWKE